MASRSKSPRKQIYSVPPSILTIQQWIEDLPRRTGRSLEEWLAVIASREGADDEQRVDWLRRTHGLGTSAATWLVERAAGRGLEKSDPQAYLAAAPGYVEALYSGVKAALRPLHDRLITLAQRLGPDVRICPVKSAVPIYRERLIAEIKPATRARVDLSLALGDEPAEGRLVGIAGRAEGALLTHRIPILKAADIDIEVERWLRKAYELSAPPA